MTSQQPGCVAFADCIETNSCGDMATSDRELAGTSTTRCEAVTDSSECSDADSSEADGKQTHYKQSIADYCLSPRIKVENGNNQTDGNHLMVCQFTGVLL